MQIIDAHAHIYDRLTGYGAKGEFRPLGNGLGIWSTGLKEQFLPPQYGDKEFLAETFLKIMEENNVDRAVLLQAGNYGFHNDYCAEMVRKYPDKFTFVGTLDPFAGYARKILEHYICDFGMKAMKFEVSQEWGMTGYHPELKLDHEVFLPILEEADKLGMTVAYDLGTREMTSFDIPALYRVRDRFPNITFVLTHCFFPGPDGFNDTRLEHISKLAGEHFHFDIANLPPCVEEAYPYPSQQAFLRAMRDAIGAERMIWGTDLPGILLRYTYRQLTDYVLDGTVFTESEIPLVMAENAKRVYHIQSKRN